MSKRSARTAGPAARAAVALAAGLLSPGPAAAETAGSTTIHIVIVETHDRLTPTPHPGIVKRHEFTVTLGADKQISETWENTDLTSGHSHIDPGGQRTTAMGDNNGKSVWHVLSADRLQRVGVKDDQLSEWNIRVHGRECAIDVRYMMKKGLVVHAAKIAGTDIDATFGPSHVTSATCTIE